MNKARLTGGSFINSNNRMNSTGMSNERVSRASNVIILQDPKNPDQKLIGTTIAPMGLGHNESMSQHSSPSRRFIASRQSKAILSSAAKQQEMMRSPLMDASSDSSMVDDEPEIRLGSPDQFMRAQPVQEVSESVSQEAEPHVN